MKTTIPYCILTSVLLFWHTMAHAQIFRGGEGDGFAFCKFESGTTASEISNSIPVVISPNPVKCNQNLQIYFSGLPSSLSIHIFRSDGAFVIKEFNKNEKCSLTFQNPGIYFLNIHQENCFFTKKIIVLP